MNRSRLIPGLVRDSVGPYARARARSRRVALETGDRRDIWRSQHSFLTHQRHAARSDANQPQPMHGSLRSLIEVAG